MNTVTSSYQSRKNMAVALRSWLPGWEPGNFLVNSYYVPGPDFCNGETYWENGRPSLATFTSRHSFLLFELLGQEPADLAWLEEEPSEWMRYDSYKKAYEYVTKLQVTNDVAERNINLLVSKMKKVRTHQRLQEVMVTTEDMRRLRENYKRRSTNKEIIQNVVDKMLRNSEAGRQWLQGELSENESSESDEHDAGSEEAEHGQEREECEVSSIESIGDDDPESGEAELEISQS